MAEIDRMRDKVSQQGVQSLREHRTEEAGAALEGDVRVELTKVEGRILKGCLRAKAEGGYQIFWFGSLGFFWPSWLRTSGFTRAFVISLAAFPV